MKWLPHAICYLVKKKPLNVPSCQLNAKNNGLVLVFNTIFILVNSDLKI